MMVRKQRPSWHYQVVRTAHAFAIHAAFPDASRRSDRLTVEAVGPTAETIEDLRTELRAMLRDIDRYGVVEAADCATSSPAWINLSSR